MGKKNKKSQKFIPLEDFNASQTHNKRSEVETPSNENSVNDVNKTQFQDKSEYEEPLGTKLDVSCNAIKHVNNEHNLNEKEKNKNGIPIDHPSKNSLNDKKEQTGEMECDVPKSINKNITVCEENNKKSNKKKETKTARLDQSNTKSSDDKKEQTGEMECDVPKSTNKNINTVCEENNKKSNKKKQNKTACLDQNNTKSLDDKKEQTGEIECDVPKSTNKNNNKVCEESDRILDSNKKKKTITSNLNQNISNSLDENEKCEKKVNEKAGKECNKISNSTTKKKKTKYTKVDPTIIINTLDKNRSDNNKLETSTSYNWQSDASYNKRTNYESFNIREEEQNRRSFQYKDRNSTDNFRIKNTPNNLKNDVEGCQSVIEDETHFLEEIDEDLFNLSKDYALAHCVAEDLRMGAGIAVDFKRIFSGVGKLLDQKLKIGDIGMVKRHDQIALYMITKQKSNGKPTMVTMQKALKSLLHKMGELKLTKLGIPKIGCGLDGLDWSEVKSLIVDIFGGSGIQICVCVPSKILDRKAPPPLKVFMTPNNLWEMEPQTDIIIFIDLEKVNKNDWSDDVINNVDTKYPFKEDLLKDLKNKKHIPGDVLTYKVKNERIICTFFLQEILYTCIENVFNEKCFKSRDNNYLAIQSGPSKSDDALKHISSIVLIFRSICSYCELWLCGDTENGHGDTYDQYCRNLANSDNSFKYNTPGKTGYRPKDYNQSPYSKGRSNDNNWHSQHSSSQNGFERRSFVEK